MGEDKRGAFDVTADFLHLLGDFGGGTTGGRPAYARFLPVLNSAAFEVEQRDEGFADEIGGEGLEPGDLLEENIVIAGKDRHEKGDHRESNQRPVGFVFA